MVDDTDSGGGVLDTEIRTNGSSETTSSIASSEISAPSVEGDQWVYSVLGDQFSPSIEFTEYPGRVEKWVQVTVVSFLTTVAWTHFSNLPGYSVNSQSHVATSSRTLT